MARVDLPMVCVCDEDGKREAAQRRMKIALNDFDMQYENMTDQLIMAIWQEHFYTIAIGCDLWFGVIAEKDDDSIFVPCDSVEDGLLAIWEYLQEQKEDSGSRESLEAWRANLVERYTGTRIDDTVEKDVPVQKEDDDNNVAE